MIMLKYIKKEDIKFLFFGYLCANILLLNVSIIFTLNMNLYVLIIGSIFSIVLTLIMMNKMNKKIEMNNKELMNEK